MIRTTLTAMPSETICKKWNDLEAAVRTECLHECEHGPTILSTSHGPDNSAALAITTCRMRCQHALWQKLHSTREAESLHAAIRSAGEPFVTLDHYDD